MPKLDYLDWNDLIARKFFNTGMAGREVLLYVTEEIINDLGSETGENIEDFIKCVKAGPDWATREGICQKALQCYEEWKDIRQGYPQYIAYLALFVLAATLSGNFDQNAYYPRLRKLLGESPKTGTYPSFDKMDKLWNDLEKWSRLYKHEELGRFTRRVRGRNVHIGIPLSQTILSEDERSVLPLIFNAAEIDPTDAPSDIAIRRMLLRYGTSHLKKRTLQLLRDKEDYAEMKNALVSFVFEEIAEWDGSICETLPHHSQFKDEVITKEYRTAQLRICFDPPDRIAKRITFSLRFKTNRSFPENGLDLEYQGQTYSCFETSPNWSRKLKNLKTATYLNAAELDWLQRTMFEDREKGWKAILRPAPVRIFFPGSGENLPGWIESHRLERNCDFIIACHASKADIVEIWGNKSCEEFRAMHFKGLPENWILFEGKNAHGPCFEIDVLNLPNQLDLQLKGGIKVGRSNFYLNFSPPAVLLKGSYGNERIIIAGGQYERELEQDLPSNFWAIPADAPVNKPLYLEVYREENEPLQREVLQLIEPVVSGKLENSPKRDALGSIITEGSIGAYARGAIVNGANPAVHNSFPPVLPTYLSKRIIFLGSSPGEITDWPKEDLPESWKPVWALAKLANLGKEIWVAHFCSHLSYEDPKSHPSRPLANRKAVKRWSNSIWVRRKRIKEPRLKALRQLWAEYMEAAKYA